MTLIGAVLYPHCYNQVSLKCAPKGYDLEKNTISENDELDMTFFTTLTGDVAEVIMKIGQMKRQILSHW